MGLVRIEMCYFDNDKCYVFSYNCVFFLIFYVIRMVFLLGLWCILKSEVVVYLINVLLNILFIMWEVL